MTNAPTQLWQRRAHPVGIATRYLAIIAALAALWFHYWWVVIPCVLYLVISIFVFPKPKGAHSPLTKAAVGAHLDTKMRRDRSDSKIPLYRIIPVLALISLIVVIYYHAIIQTVLLAIMLAGAQVYFFIRMLKLFDEAGKGALDDPTSGDSEAQLADGFMKARDGKSAAKLRPKQQKTSAAKPVPQPQSRMEQILETARKQARTSQKKK